MGAVKEEGRLKEEEEDSLSETLRVLETATGLGGPNMKCPQIKKNITQNKELSVQAQKWIRGKKNKWGAYEGSKQWQETCDAIVRGQRGRRWRDYRLIKVLQIDYNVCAHTLLTRLKERQPVLMIKLALAISSNKTQKLNPAKVEREGICITAKRNKLLTPANITKQTQNPSLKLQRVINCKLAYIYLLCSNSGLTDCCLRSGVCLFCIGNWPSKEMRFFTGGWLKVWARRRNWKPASGSSSGKAGGEPGGEWPGDSSSCWRGQNV